MVAPPPLLREALEATELKTPRVPVLANVDASPHSGDAARMREALLRQLTAPVQWESSMHALLDGGYEDGLAVGPGKVTAALLKGVARRAKVRVIEA